MKEYKVVVIQPDQDQCLSDAQILCPGHYVLVTIV